MTWPPPSTGPRMPETRSIFDLEAEALADVIAEWGEPRYRASQIWQGLYRRLLSSAEGLTDLPRPLRERVAAELPFATMTPRASLRSSDGRTDKHLLALADGEAIEVVVMHYDRRRTACISTQVGCAMGCSFCATGQMGFRRHLRPGEIVEQVILIARLLAQQGTRLTNIVVMGMGEPFHNYDATMAAVDRLNDPTGFHFGARRFTLSTVGLVPMIERFSAEKRQVNLAVSLHAATNELRSQLLPVNRRYPLEVLMPACRGYVQSTGRRLTFEWALIEGVNDTQEQAAALAGWVAGLNCHVNLIPLNPTRLYAGAGSSADRSQAFAAALTARGIACTVRLRRGIDIQAGCGQLATESPTPG